MYVLTPQGVKVVTSLDVPQNFSQRMIQQIFYALRIEMFCFNI